MADIKTLLKEARKLIDEGNFKDAQECCKNILRADKQNYFGLVMFGKSLQDSNQAPLAYQKAITSKRDHPLAWQGLAQYYERNTDDDVSKQKLLSIYIEMLNLEMEEEKTREIITKIGQLGVTLKSTEVISFLLSYSSKTENENLKNIAKIQIVELLNVDIPCNKEEIPVIMRILAKLYANEPRDSLEMLQCKVAIQKSDRNSALKDLIKLEFCTKKAALKEFVCQWLCSIFVESMKFNNIDVEKTKIITEGIENTKHATLLNSMVSYDKGLYLEAYKQCVPLIDYNEANVTEATFIIKCTMMLKKWPVMQKLATNFINKTKDEKFALQLRVFIFYSLVKQQKWKEAIANAKLIPLDALNAEEVACLAECYIENEEPVDHLMETLKSTEYYKQLEALIYLKQGECEEVVNLLQQPSDNALHNFYLGRAYWELTQYNNCLIHLLKAAKFNPDHADTFLYLGHFYDQKNDLIKGKKCYEKAYGLNNKDINIVKSLSGIYIKLKLSELNYELLSSFVKDAGMTEPWVHFRLGLQNLNKRDWESAVGNFRNVIKEDKNDAVAFECLADAYYSRGSYTSALRAYSKVMTLDASKATYCMTKIGYIHSLLTNYQEAITTFENVIKISPLSHLALKGIAETWIRVAKKKLEAKIFGSARNCAQSAVDYIIVAIKNQNKFPCFWKLLADTILFITKLPDQYAYVFMPHLSNNSDNEPVRQQKTDIISQAIACYSYIAKQKQQEASYELAYTYFLYYQEKQEAKNGQIAFNLATICVKEKPKSWRNWNLLGKISLVLNKYEQAQHCFIKALMVTKKLSAAKIWCNLGSLYIKLKLFKLANYCFWRGQSTLPSYPQSWIGQALIAEAIREEEAMDLFRHASRLGYHPESALGYTDWVCRTMKKYSHTTNTVSKYAIEGLNAIPYAIDLMEWLGIFEPNNACANNIRGVLQEKIGLLKPAIKSYEKAFQYSEDKHKSIILLNIGRILLRLEKYDEAIKIFKAIPEASFNSTVGLALALFKKGLYEESYAAYDTALHWLCTDEHEKSELFVAMAGIIYMFKGHNDAKTMLFQSIQASQSKPSPYSLLAICSLGITHSEQSISKLALSELRKYEKDKQFVYDIGFLRSYYFICEDDVDQAISLLSETVLDDPGNGLLWFCLAQYCLRGNNTNAKAASSCARKALSSGHFSNCNLVNVYAAASIAEHLAGHTAEALRLAKVGLHLYPNHAQIWAALLFSLLSNKNCIEKNWLLSAAGHMRRHLTISRPLSRWVSLVEKKLVST